MPDRVRHLEDPLLRHEAVDLVSRDDVALLQRLDGEVLARLLVLGEDYLRGGGRGVGVRGWGVDRGGM